MLGISRLHRPAGAMHGPGGCHHPQQLRPDLFATARAVKPVSDVPFATARALTLAMHWGLPPATAPIPSASVKPGSDVLFATARAWAMHRQICHDPQQLRFHPPRSSRDRTSSSPPRGHWQCIGDFPLSGTTPVPSASVKRGLGVFAMLPWPLRLLLLNHLLLDVRSLSHD